MKTAFGEMSDDERAFWKRLGDKVFECRKRHLLSQKELGDKLGLSRCSIANLEGGRQRMTAYRMHQIEKMIFDIAGLK